MINKKCKICAKEFTVDDSDLEFYKKVSPVLDGEKCEMSPPTLCPEHRMIRRMSWGNERKLYKRKCSLCRKEIVSIFSDDKNLHVLCRECYWSDKWNPLDQGRDFDFNRPFFEQLEELLRETRLLALFATNVESSDYVNQEYNSYNCYLCSGGNDNHSCYYCASCMYDRNNIDCFGAGWSDNLYSCTLAISDYGSQYLFNCNLCTNCYFCFDCTGCNDCFGSVNLRYKKYIFFNHQLTKVEYFEKIKEYLSSYDGIKRAVNEFAKHKLKYIYHSANLMFSKDCTGDTLIWCKNVKDSYYSTKTENSRYIFIVDGMNEVMDALSIGKGELCYEVGSGMRLYGSAFLSSCDKIRNSYYCFHCTNSNDLFGCIGINREQYCILNKKYTREEYEDLVPRIIAHMKKTGEWGEFFPMSLSPFGYNETIAEEFYPLTKEQAKKIGANWHDQEDNAYKGPFYEPKSVDRYNPKINPDAQKEINRCIAGIIKCEKTGRPFKVMPKELAQYIEKNIQLPRIHPDRRHLDRLNLINKMKLYHRQCTCQGECEDHSGRCKNEFETTFEPERQIKVFCDRCYYRVVK